MTPQLDNPDLQDLPLAAAGFGRWIEELGAGRPIHGFVAGFPASERDILQAQSIVSLAVVPVFVDRRWWGFIGFDECLGVREWTDVEIDALSVAASLFGSGLQRRQAEEALWQTREDYRLLAENVSDIIWRTDAEGRFTYLSPAVRDLGYEAEELLGRPFADVLPAVARARFQRNFRARLADAAPYRDDLRIVARDGSLVWHDVSVSFQVSGNTATAAVGVARNIEDRKRAEAKLAEVNRCSLHFTADPP